ncbi:hypothetical protein MCOR14_000924 [Pyricularia oryzae]|nr:hypothetical protein MCOR28_004281 [Pyricularia oryzae]KAI6644694.1 hypothetical protein MCOR14_000924 [Pyricularia oryzae]
MTSYFVVIDTSAKHQKKRIKLCFSYIIKATLIFISTLLAAVGINAAPSEPCYGPDGAAGVCLSSSEYTKEGGKTIDGAGRIVEAWPGRIRQVYCARDCRCGEGSDHCCGKATDMMCSDAGDAATLAGREVAEWAVRNRDELCHLGSENEARQEGRGDGLGTSGGPRRTGRMLRRTTGTMYMLATDRRKVNNAKAWFIGDTGRTGCVYAAGGAG